MKRLMDMGLEAMVATSRPSSGWMVGAALVSAVGALAAAGRKLVVMNRWRFPDGNDKVPQPTEPMDDFSIALWEYAKLALDKSGLEVAQIHYNGGVPSNGQENVPYGEQDIAQIQFYRNADAYESADSPLGSWAVKWYSVTRDGDLRKHIERAWKYENMNYDPVAKMWVHKKPPYDVVGNICKWKFKKEALSAPPARPEPEPDPEITTTTRIGRRRR